MFGGKTLRQWGLQMNNLDRPEKKYSLVHIGISVPRNKVYAKELASALAKNELRSSEIVEEYTSENTKKAYASDIIYWQAWLSAIRFPFEEPLSEEIIKLFAIHHIEEMPVNIDEMLVGQGYKAKLGQHAAKTVERRTASLSVFLDLKKWGNPCRNKEVRILMTKLRKKYGTVKKAKAITKDILDDFVATCGDRLIDIRDKALLLFAWASGGRRRSEVASATLENLTEMADGDFVYNLTLSKTNQNGNDEHKPVKGRAAKALRDWLQASGVAEGYIFRAIAKAGWVKEGGLIGSDVRRIVKRRAKLAGYDEKMFSAHSLRSGFTTEAGKQGKPLGDVMAMTGHRNVSTAMAYYQAGNVVNNTCAELVG